MKWMILLFIHVVCSWDERVNADGGLSWESLCQRHSPSPPLNISLRQPAELNTGRGFSRTPSFWRAGVLSTTWWPCMGFCDGWKVKNSSMLLLYEPAVYSFLCIECSDYRLHTFAKMYSSKQTTLPGILYPTMHSACPFILKVMFIIF